MKKNYKGYYKKLLGAGVLVTACAAVLLFMKTESAHVSGMEGAEHKKPVQPEQDASQKKAEVPEPEDVQTPQAAVEAEDTQASQAAMEAEDTREPETAEVFDWNAIGQLRAGSTIDTSMLTETEISRLFYSQEITDSIFGRINGISYQENDSIGREDLSYLRVLHMGFDGQVHVGELIVNRQIAEDILAIMKKLYENQYPIEKMVLVDEYGGDDNLSMEDNNSSAFNYRVIAGTTRMSKHSLGLAIDINPKYNPYVRPGEEGEIIVEPAGSEAYTDRQRDFDHKIDENDLSYQLFTQYGFTWGGSWNTVKDYQHFQKTTE